MSPNAHCCTSKLISDEGRGQTASLATGCHVAHALAHPIRRAAFSPNETSRYLWLPVTTPRSF